MAVTTAAAASAATAIHKYTYTLGRSLYVPVTSRCNSTPLTVTRGPGFLLPRGVAEPLLRFRDAECGPGVYEGSAAASVGAGEGAWGLSGDERVHLPYPLPLVNGLYPQFDNDDLSTQLQQQRRNIARAEAEPGGSSSIDDLLKPSIETLVNEVRSRLKRDDGNNPQNNLHEVVIAGEGEPTLRMDALLAIARTVKSLRSAEQRLPVRLITNGLCYGIPNLGYSPFNHERSSVMLPMHRHVILRDLLEAGITKSSVALNTADRHEYDSLMRPSCHHSGRGTGVGSREGGGDEEGHCAPGTAYDIVCEFILEATKAGIDVEITGVMRPGIDREETERLAEMLLSAGPRCARRRRVRWRTFFD